MGRKADKHEESGPYEVSVTPDLITLPRRLTMGTFIGAATLLVTIAGAAIGLAIATVQSVEANAGAIAVVETNLNTITKEVEDTQHEVRSVEREVDSTREETKKQLDQIQRQLHMTRFGVCLLCERSFKPEQCAAICAEARNE